MFIKSILENGAKPGIQELQTQCIQKTIDEVFLAGGGEVTIPKGRYRIGGLRLRSHVTLHLLEDAVLEASRDPEDYFILDNDTVEPFPKELIVHEGLYGKRNEPLVHLYGHRWHNAIIRACFAKDIAIIGEAGSIIDGMNCYDEGGEEQYRGPHGISIIKCDHIVLRGFTIQNSGNWPESIWWSSDLLCEYLTNLAGHDGVHFTSCEDVIIRKCSFYTGDDCIAGFDNQNVLVEDCEINTACSAFRFGGTNVLVHHCHIFAPARYTFRGVLTKEEKKLGINKEGNENKRYNMLSIFTYYADFSTTIRCVPGNIVIRDCLIEGADRFLYFNYSGASIWQQNRPLGNITFENLDVRDLSMPLTAYGDSDQPCDVTLKRVNISLRQGFEDLVFINAANFNRITLQDVRFSNSTSQVLAKIWPGNGNQEICTENVTGIGLDCEHPKEKFDSKPI